MLKSCLKVEFVNWTHLEKVLLQLAGRSHLTKKFLFWTFFSTKSPKDGVLTTFRTTTLYSFDFKSKKSGNHNKSNGLKLKKFIRSAKMSYFGSNLRAFGKSLSIFGSIEEFIIKINK